MLTQRSTPHTQGRFDARCNKNNAKMSSNNNMLYTLPALDKLFEAIPADQIKRLPSNQVNDLINISDAENIPEFIKDLTVVPHCHVIGMLQFELFGDRKSSGCSTPISSSTKDTALAMALAVQHLNTGNPSIVNTLGKLRESMCSNTVFTIEYVDTRNDPGLVINEVFNVTERKVEDYGYKMPCSFVGAGGSAVTLPSALLTGHKGYMKVSGTSTASQLDYDDQYPNFARTIPPESDNVVPIIAYFTDILELEYLAVIHMNEPYGNSFAEALARETDKLGVLNVRRISIDSTGDTIKSALNELKASQYRYVFAVMPNTHFYNELLFTAFEIGLAGKKSHYQWFFSDSFSDNGGIDLSNNTLRMAYTGTGKIRPSAGRLYHNSKFNDFASQLRDLSTSREGIEYTYRMVSTWPKNSYDNFTDEDIFTSNSNCTSNSPRDTSAFLYDATIAVGMSACYAIGLGNGQGFTGDAQFDLLTQQTRFDGATGDVDFDNITGSRTYSSTSYELTNYMTEEWLDDSTGKYRTDYKKTITNSYYKGEWVNGGETFIFSNGMTMPNQPDQVTPRNPQENLTPTYMKVLALSFSAFSMVLAIGFGLWTWRHRSTRVVKASQPFFLFLLLFGVIMVASSIIPYSMDDNTFPESACDKDDDSTFPLSACDRTCTAIFWLIFPGLSIVFSALFTKTYRINLMYVVSLSFFFFNRNCSIGSLLHLVS